MGEAVNDVAVNLVFWGSVALIVVGIAVVWDWWGRLRQRRWQRDMKRAMRGSW